MHASPILSFGKRSTPSNKPLELCTAPLHTNQEFCSGVPKNIVGDNFWCVKIRVHPEMTQMSVEKLCKSRQGESMAQGVRIFC